MPMRSVVPSATPPPPTLFSASEESAWVATTWCAPPAADLVLSVGGVSRGRYDLVRPAVEELGRLDFWKVAMRPGKPLAVGEVLGRPFGGLPGNPVSALVGFEVFVLPALLQMGGRHGWRRPSVKAELAAPLSTPPGLRTFARARLEARPDAVPLA